MLRSGIRYACPVVLLLFPKHLFMASARANAQGRWTFCLTPYGHSWALTRGHFSSEKGGNTHLVRDDFCKWEVGSKVYFQICGEVLLTYKQKNWKSVLWKEPVPGAQCQCFISGHCKPFGDSDALFHHVFPSDGVGSLFEPQTVQGDSDLTSFAARCVAALLHKCSLPP